MQLHFLAWFKLYNACGFPIYLVGAEGCRGRERTNYFTTTNVWGFKVPKLGVSRNRCHTAAPTGPVLYTVSNLFGQNAALQHPSRREDSENWDFAG